MPVDLLADAREWLASQGDRVQTHSGDCHRWHPACLVSRLLRELESRTGSTSDSDADHPEREAVAPAAIASGSDRPDNPAPRPAGTGNKQEPVAWLAFATDGSESSAVYMMQEQAQAAADEWGWSIAPLYCKTQGADE